MGVLLAIAGALIGAIAFIAAVMVAPESAVQQTVQELRFIECLLGLIVLALGCVLFRLDHPRGVTPADPRLARLAALGLRVDGLSFRAGDGAPIFDETNTSGPWGEQEKRDVTKALAPET